MFATLRTVAACAALATLTVASSALAGPAGSGGSVDGGSYHLYQTPEQMRLTGRTPPILTQGAMEYWGGPVFSNVKVVSVMWGPNVNSQTVAGMPGFLSAIVNSTYV